MPDRLPEGGYGNWAWQYRERLWQSVLPIPARRKTPPPDDYTGRKASKIPDDVQIAEWVIDWSGGNLALRMPSDVIGIDVDAYEYTYQARDPETKQKLTNPDGSPLMVDGLKTGDITIAEMEDLLGELPPTWRSSSRTAGVSGIRLYRVPASLLWGDVGEHVETIWWGHRYALVWPSINPDSRLPYLWLNENDPDQGWGVSIPKVTDLAELPEAWVRRLSKETVEPGRLVTPGSAIERVRATGSHDPSEPRTFTRQQAADFVQPHLDELRHAPGGTINNRLNDAAKVIGHFVPAFWSEHQARILLADALRDTIYDGKTWRADTTITSAFDSALGDWRAVLVSEPTPPPGGARTRSRGDDDVPWPTEGPDDPPEVAGFWDSRPALGFIRDFALQRYAAPWAVLGATLARAVACVEPNIQIPAVIGTEASLNLFVGLIGQSGGGKDIANGVAKALLLPVEGRDPVPLDVIPLGSGEGLSHIYMKPPPKLTKRKGEPDEDSAAIGLGFNPDPDAAVQYRTRALVNIAEIDTMGSLSQRRGSTIGGQLRQAWSGQQLGFQYVDLTKRMIVPEHSYRLCLTAGIQPARAGVLLEETDGGTPQRFLWLPAYNPELADPTDEQIDNPPPLMGGTEWSPPAYRAGSVTIKVCSTARRTIVRAHIARGRGEGDALDGHSLLNRLKTAAALAILCGDSPQRQCEVTEEDWELSGVVMAVSDRTREFVQRVLAEQARVENEKKAIAEAHKAIVVSERVEDDAVTKVTRWLRKSAWIDEWRTEQFLRSKKNGAQKGLIGDAIDALLQAGEIEAREYEVNNGTTAREVRRTPQGGRDKGGRD